MKTLKIKLLAFGITVLLMGIVFLAHAGDLRENPELETMANLESYFEQVKLNTRLEKNLESDCEVHIYNSENQLIMTGSANEEKIKTYIPQSDLLTEVDGTKYYRLSYK